MVPDGLAPPSEPDSGVVDLPRFSLSRSPSRIMSATPKNIMKGLTVTLLVDSILLFSPLRSDIFWKATCLGHFQLTQLKRCPKKLLLRDV
jgi:hypothetical protein